jgi:hypothetical protein
MRIAGLHVAIVNNVFAAHCFGFTYFYPGSSAKSYLACCMAAAVACLPCAPAGLHVCALPSLNTSSLICCMLTAIHLPALCTCRSPYVCISSTVNCCWAPTSGCVQRSALLLHSVSTPHSCVVWLNGTYGKHAQHSTQHGSSSAPLDTIIRQNQA